MGQTRCLRPGGLVLLVALAVALAAAGPARADVYTVTTAADGAAGAGCTAVQCTLRAAIQAAAVNQSASDTISVPARTYTLSTGLGPLTVPQGTTGLSIEGAGAATTIIEPQLDVEFPLRVLVVSASASVRVSGVTLRGGRAPSGAGGNVLVQGGASVNLDRVRVTLGQAPQGGGIAAQAGGAPTTLRITRSLIDSNTATGTAITAAGGGLYLEGATAANDVTVEDSTIAGNGARNGAGIAVVNNAGQPPALRGVTLARNTARAGTPPGVGGISSSSATVRFQGSLIAGNTSTVNLGAGPIAVPANCSFPAQTPATDEGGNLAFQDRCGLAGAVDADPLLASDLDASQPPALAIAAQSPAVDIADCAGRTADQRGVARPQGARCDAGAYEYTVPAEPTPAPTAPPVATVVATPAPTAPPVATVVPTPAPTPVRGQRVVAAEVSGTVLVRPRGSSRFVALDAAQSIPLGSEVDARRGRVRVTALPRAGAPPETADFYAGRFTIRQAGSFIELRLSERLTGCPKGTARVAQKRKPKTRKLWGDGKGRFRSRGQYSAATVRGTKWLVQDGCRYTRTRVAQGSVLVRDRVRKRNVVLRKGRSYTARPRR